MKDEKFKKVVEWDKEPNIKFVILGFSFLVCGGLSLIKLVNDKIDYFPLSLLVILAISVGLVFSRSYLGEGRKVYWRKIK